MPSLFSLAALSLAFPCVLSFALRPTLETRGNPKGLEEALRKLPKCQNVPYRGWPAGLATNGDAEIGKRDQQNGIDPAKEAILCSGTETYIRMNRTAVPDAVKHSAADEIEGLAGDTWTYITRQHIENGHKDGVISKTEEWGDGGPGIEGRGWIYSRISQHGNYKLRIANAHERAVHYRWFSTTFPYTFKIEGHEITWGVLREALNALAAHMMRDADGWSTANFEIWDGLNKVGYAMIVKNL
ncbi:MAG: hypothetical protein Q9174_005350, partial [Haloplaca sp. 1 TL-2023]